jgi:hypothetical protein
MNNAPFPYLDAICTEESTRRAYAAPGGGAPEVVLKVRDAEMLAATVRWARTQRRSLAPASSAAPHRRACQTIPKDAWILDFSGMKRVLKLNRRNRVAIFEPGLTFGELSPMVRQHGLRLLTPLLPRPGKSALAAYLDREPVIQPRYQWDLADPLLCIEVIYGTGDLMRTGSAGGPGTLEQQWRAGEFQKSPMGPGQNDWMRLVQGAQGAMGLATWCSAKCEVLPKVQRLYVAGADRLEPLVEASYRQFRAAVRSFCSRAAAPLIAAGAFFSRPHGDWAEPAMAAAHSSRWIFEEMKEIFDPDHILVPGRLRLGGAAHGLKKVMGQLVVYEPPRPVNRGTYGVYDAPRRLLAAIPGVELVEFYRRREYAFSCADEGVLRAAGWDEFLDSTARHRMEEAREVGAEIVASACPSSEENLAAVARDFSIRIADVVDLLHGSVTG